MSTKNIAIVVTGSIAAVKTFDLVELLRAKGMAVSLVLTEAAQQWVTKEAALAITGQPALTADDVRSDLARAAKTFEQVDAVMVAPASADFIKQLAYKDTPLAQTIRSSAKPLFIAPAMNFMMWQHPAVQRNVKKTIVEGVQFLGPVSGNMACGDRGYGRFMEPDQLAGAIGEAMGNRRDHAVFSAIGSACIDKPALPSIDKVMAAKQNKNILLVVQGGQDALSTYALIRNLRTRGHNVTCVIGEQAQPLLPSAGIAAISHNSVYTHHYQDDVQGMEHIRLPEQSDIVLVAPATARGVNEMAQGGAQSFAGCLYLATKKPVVLVPSADAKEAIASADLECLKRDGVAMLSVPRQLPLAGKRRAEAIADALEQLLQRKAAGAQEHAA